MSDEDELDLEFTALEDVSDGGEEESTEQSDTLDLKVADEEVDAGDGEDLSGQDMIDSLFGDEGDTSEAVEASSEESISDSESEDDILGFSLGEDEEDEILETAAEEETSSELSENFIEDESGESLEAADGLEAGRVKHKAEEEVEEEEEPIAPKSRGGEFELEEMGSLSLEMGTPGEEFESMAVDVGDIEEPAQDTLEEIEASVEEASQEEPAAIEEESVDPFAEESEDGDLSFSLGEESVDAEAQSAGEMVSEESESLFAEEEEEDALDFSAGEDDEGQSDDSPSESFKEFSVKAEDVEEEHKLVPQEDVIEKEADMDDDDLEYPDMGGGEEESIIAAKGDDDFETSEFEDEEDDIGAALSAAHQEKSTESFNPLEGVEDLVKETIQQVSAKSSSLGESASFEEEGHTESAPSISQEENVSLAAESERSSHQEYVVRHESELIRLQGTIRSLREERNTLLQKIKEMEGVEHEQRQENLSLKAELDDKRIEVSLLKKRHIEDVQNLKYESSLLLDKKNYLEEKIKHYSEEFNKLNQRVKIDYKKVQMREKELENQLELLQSDAQLQIKNREEKILELKRKIDALEFDLENLSGREQQFRESQYLLEDKFTKVMATLRMAMGVLDESDVARDVKEPGLKRKKLDS